MKITLEFDNIESFFRQLPRFASLMNFSGQFANITHKPKADTEAALEEPDLPVVERPAPGVTRIHGTASETAEAAGKKIEAAYDAAAAAALASGPAEAPQAAQEAAPGDAPTADPAPAETPAEAAQEPPAEVKDADVRRALNMLIKAGKREMVKTILKEFGAANFTGLKKSDYPDVLKRAEEEAGK